MPGRLLLAVVALLCCAPHVPAAQPGKAWEAVDIAPTKTSIYIGTVTMTMPRFMRHGFEYRSTYAAKVFPYFFSSEHGTLSVEITDEQLAALADGKSVDFTGRAQNQDGAERKVTGQAVPLDRSSGKLKVRVFVSKRIQLIFNTTYRFVETPGVAVSQ